MKITKDSHVDHALSEIHLNLILTKFGAREGFFIETIELPMQVDPLPCGLHGPIVGDDPVADSECVMEARGDRPGLSRICGRPSWFSRRMTVIGGLHEGQTILFTAFGGPAAPREPFDPSLFGDPSFFGADLEVSKAFWAQHALSRTP